MFLGRVPWALDLCRELGLADELISPAASAAHVWHSGRAHPLPPDLVLGAPTRVAPLLRSGLLSTAGALRAGLDLVSPRRDLGDDPSVGALVRSRFGDEVCDLLVDPLIGGINAGAADDLSAAASAPQLAEASRSSRSLLLGLRRQRARASLATDGPVFWSLSGGLVRLVDALVEAARAAGVSIHTGDTARTLHPVGDGTLVECEEGDVVASHVVAATPARITADLVAHTAPGAADALRCIETASVAMAVIAVDADAIRRPLDGAGLLFPRVEGRLVTAVSFGSAKWPGWAAPDQVVMRASVGRHGDDRGLELDDAALLGSILDELDEALGIDASPLAAQIVRWRQAFPQYQPGHFDRVDDARQRLAERLPGVVLAGASYEGLGIPACIRQGGEAADHVTRTMGAESS